MIDYKFFTDFQKELYTEHGYMLEKLSPSTDFWYVNKRTNKKQFVFGVASHQYHIEYAKLFSPLRHKKLKILEIGVFNGFSMLLWNDFFPNAEIYGIDINLSHSHRGITPRQLCKNKKRIHLFELDAYKKQSVENFMKEVGGNFDIIIEDGSHHPIHQLQALSYFLPYINKEGMFIMEDVIRGEHQLKRYDRRENNLFTNNKMFYLDEYLQQPNKFNFDIDLSLLKKFECKTIEPKEYSLRFTDTNLEGRECIMKMETPFKLMIFIDKRL